MITPGKYPLQWDALQIGWEQFKILSWRALVSEYWCSVYRRGPASGDRALQPRSHTSITIISFHITQSLSDPDPTRNLLLLKTTWHSFAYNLLWCPAVDILSASINVMEFSCRLTSDYIFESHIIRVDASLEPNTSKRICILNFVIWREK